MLSVVMPAHNEQGYLDSAVRRVAAGLTDMAEDFEIIIAENGSSDGTMDEATALAAELDSVVLLTLPDPDYGAALKAGFLAARGDVVVNFDVDLVDLGFVERALAALDAPEVCIVIGSKRTEGSLDQRGPGRRLVTAAFSAVLRHVFGLRVSDTHGLKALRRDPLRPLVARCRFGKDIFDTELVLRAERAALEVTEIPVTVADHRPPRTPIIRRIPRTLWGLARLRIALYSERS